MGSFELWICGQTISLLFPMPSGKETMKMLPMGQEKYENIPKSTMTPIKKCKIQGCENKPNPEYWIEFEIENNEARVQVNICWECYQKISTGQSYSI
jgi:hypothetical protein